MIYDHQDIEPQIAACVVNDEVKEGNVLLVCGCYR
jgi:hypothetical protein